MKNIKIIVIIFVVLLTLILAWLFLFNKKKSPAYNVILITIDSLRPDHLGCYGYKRNTSPNIDKIADQGVIFTQAVSQGPHTLASVPSFITSSHPYMHFIDQEGHSAYLNPHTETLPGVLKRAGYSTALFTDHPTHFGRIEGIKDKFDTNVELVTWRPRELTREVIGWLEKNKKQKFFIWAYYFGPHGPYVPTPPYSEDFLDDGLFKTGKNIPVQQEEEKKVFGVIPAYLAENGITDVDYYIANYDGKIRTVDDQIGLLLEGLARLGLSRDTLIILMSDHGESLGEHGCYFNHGFTLYEEAVKVPLIMNYPNIIPKRKVVAAQVRLMDMAPTVLDIIGLKKNKGMEGESLLPCVTNKNCSTAKYAFTNTGSIYSVRSQDWKLLYVELEKIENNPELKEKSSGYYKHAYELYDLKNDPREENNLSVERQEVFGRLRGILDEYVFEAGKQQVLAKEAASQWYFKAGTPGPPPDEETRERLKSLGYIQ